MQSQQTLRKAFGGSDDVYSFKVGGRLTDRVEVEHYEDGEYRSDFILPTDHAQLLWETLKESGYHPSRPHLIVVVSAPATPVRAPSRMIPAIVGVAAIVAAAVWLYLS